MTLSLPMYDLPPCRAETDRLRRALASVLGTTPSDSGDAQALWHDPSLVLSQTCGWPLLTAEAERLTPVATFVYGAAGCEKQPDCATYRSYLVAREGGGVTRPEDAIGKTAAVNEWGSWSGRVILAHAFRDLVPAGEAVFGDVFISGAHARSLMAVRAGRADVAAVDGVTFSLLAKHQPAMVEGLAILAETDWAPALPLVTRKGASAAEIARLRDGIGRVLADPAMVGTLEALLIRDWVPTDLTAYDRSRALAEQARSVVLHAEAPALATPA
ncbi:MAG: PhnD/SsuA/transferrin family substrate-binding protein [Alphaproteobacteria bacterium]|nr:PhnD/SsuA/transferrin family substrate-binding protein [Alphaproteobacteria bacterium]